ncbi:7,8-dihydro-6-hydroxymethylpterin dimethyltransferase [uncultured archaeon]|nr:7,8-dihydro-6-hydroxymethylpterin dimethyltransferase [uncultured archaeon]
MRGRKVAVWTSTNRCNLNCRFCFGREKREEFGTRDAKEMIRELKKGGIRHMVFSGGEPLLRKDIFTLAAHARRLGLKTILHTNGILVNAKNAARIARLFDIVNLPIDGADEKKNRMMGRGSLKHTLDALDLLSVKTSVTVSTVATRRNMGEMGKIARLLQGRKIRKWRVFRFDPKLGEAKRNSRAFGISAGEFSGLKRKTKAKHAEFISPEGAFGQSYWLIASDGTIDI